MHMLPQDYDITQTFNYFIKLNKMLLAI